MKNKKIILLQCENNFYLKNYLSLYKRDRHMIFPHSLKARNSELSETISWNHLTRSHTHSNCSSPGCTQDLTKWDTHSVFLRLRKYFLLDLLCFVFYFVHLSYFYSLRYFFLRIALKQRSNLTRCPLLTIVTFFFFQLKMFFPHSVCTRRGTYNKVIRPDRANNFHMENRMPGNACQRVQEHALVPSKWSQVCISRLQPLWVSEHLGINIISFS